MQITGEWYVCDDGVTRPVVRGDALSDQGDWEPVPFLVDTGADCTVFSALALDALGLGPVPADDRIAGVGGLVNSIIVQTTIRFLSVQGDEVTFRGQFAAVTDPETLDMSVLGRDILNLFAVIVDRPGDVVCLVCQRHRYAITEG